MLKRILVLLTFVMVGVLVAPAVAQADPDPGGGGSGSGCYATGCDGKSPYDTGCVNDQISVVGSRYFYTATSYVELRYSQRCRAAWAYTSIGTFSTRIFARSTYLNNPDAIRWQEEATAYGDYRTTKMVSTTYATQACMHTGGGIIACGYRETTQL